MVVAAANTNTEEDTIIEIYLSAFSREPSMNELQEAMNFIEVADWQSFCHSIFNMKEFIYLI